MPSETGREIREAVTMAQVAGFYGINIGRGGFAKCPFHQGDNTPSLKIYDHSFYCFGCGKGGDVITFAMELQGLGYHDACEAIDRAFSLGIVERKQSFLERRQMEAKRAQRIMAEIEARQAEARYEEQTKLLTKYHRWLLTQPCSPEAQADIDYITRLLDRHQPISLDVEALINALLSKHPNRGEFLIE